MYVCPHAEEWLTLSFLPGLGPALISRLVEYFQSPAEILRAGEGLRSVAGIGPELCRRLADPANRAAASRRAADELQRLEREHASLLSLYCPAFPDSLRHIPDPPLLLYCRGNRKAVDQPCIAVVGSRAATTYGKRISALLGQELARAGVTVVSGGAYGIDAAAHSGTLSGQGRTVAVLGCGVDVVYPQPHGQLFSSILERGALFSEYPLGTKPEGYRFPARNRIISGLAKGVVVVEATEKSGSLITARLALDQGREVFAVPGRIDSVKSSGCHGLIQQGAHLVQRVEDILRECRLLSEVQPNVSAVTAIADGVENIREQTLLDCLEVYPKDIDTLGRELGWSSGEVHALLLQLELKGLARQLPGQQYEKAS